MSGGCPCEIGASVARSFRGALWHILCIALLEAKGGLVSTNYEPGANGPQSGRFTEMAKGGADLFRRAMSVAAREELNQAREETVGRIAPVAKSTGMMVGGAALALYGAVYIVQGIVRALSLWLPPWLAYLLTGLLIAAGGAALVETGRRQVKSADPTTPTDVQ